MKTTTTVEIRVMDTLGRREDLTIQSLIIEEKKSDKVTGTFVTDKHYCVQYKDGSEKEARQFAAQLRLESGVRDFAKVVEVDEETGEIFE